MMPTNDLRTEQDLRDALHELSHGAPQVVDVAPGGTPTSPVRRRRTVRWVAPLAAAVVVITLALGLTQPWGGSGADDQPVRGRLDTLMGLRWQVQAVGDLSAGRGLTMYIKPNGVFLQNLGGCSSLAGKLTLSPTTLTIEQARYSIGLCPVVPPVSPNADDIITALRKMFTGRMSWSISDGQLTLHKDDGQAAVYSPEPGWSTRTRQWTFHGVGISLPADWPANAEHCGTPVEDTVIFPHATLDCLVGRPAGVTSVEFRSYDAADEFASILGRPSATEIDGVPAVERTGTDGKRQLRVIEVRIPSHNTTVVIASPSQVRPFELESALYLPSR